MNLQFYVEKLKHSEKYKKFIEENKDAFFASGFFVVDFQGSDNKQHFDFYIPSKNEMFSFKLEDGCKKIPVEIVDNIDFKPVPLDMDFEFDKIKEKIENELVVRKIKTQIQKMLLSLQRKGDKDYLLGTIFVSNFGLLKVTIDLADMKVTDFEKKSFFDMLQISKKEKKEE